MISPFGLPVLVRCFRLLHLRPIQADDTLIVPATSPSIGKVHENVGWDWFFSVEYTRCWRYENGLGSILILVQAIPSMLEFFAVRFAPVFELGAKFCALPIAASRGNI
jgi:hypothetical protein